jgi:hypothetical protein
VRLSRHGQDQRPSVRWLATLLVVAATALLPACAGWQCSKARLALTPIDRSGLGGPVTLEVRLTSGGDPVRGAPISFFVLWEDPDNPDRGRLIGHADTDTDGFARLSFERGLAALQPTYAVNGFSAEFRATGAVPGRENDFCRAQGKFKFT